MRVEIPDILYIDRQAFRLSSRPPFDEHHPGVRSATAAEWPARGGSLLSRVPTFWAGYRATWKIEEGRLFLVSLDGRLRLTEGEPVLADWFSGVLRASTGDRVGDPRMGFGPVYERESFLAFEGGALLGVRTWDGRVLFSDFRALATLAAGEVPGGATWWIAEA